MTFRNEDGEDIEYNGKFIFTKQSISPLNGNIKGDVSINFSIDNTSYNRKVLGYYGSESTNQIAFSRLPFTRIKDNAILDKGYIIIQGDDNNLDCFYLSGNSNWIQLLQFYISEMDLSDHRTLWNITNIQQSPTSGVIFCLADWIADGERGSDRYSLIAPSEVENENNILTQPLTIPDFYPCFYLHSLVDRIMERAGIKLSGDLKNDPLYKSKVIGPDSPLITRDVTLSKITGIGLAQSFTAGVIAQYTNFVESSDPDNLFSSNAYTANKYTSIIFNIRFSGLSLSSTSYAIIRKNGVDVFYYNNSLMGSFTHSLVCSPGDVFELYIRRATNGSVTVVAFTIYEASQIWPRDWVEPQFFLPKIKAIDIIKYLVNFFCCSVYFDQFAKILTLNIIDNISKESSLDWSDKYVNHSVDYSDVNKNNFIEWDGSTLNNLIKDYNKNKKLDFADGNIETESDIKQDATLIKFPFSPSNVLINTNSSALLNSPLIKLNVSNTLVFTTFNSTTNTYTVVTDTGTGNLYAPYQYFRAYENNDSNKGIFFGNYAISGGSLSIRLFNSGGFSSGRVNTFTIEYIKGLRIYTVRPSTAPSDIGVGASMRVVWETPDSSANSDCTQKFNGVINNYTDITSFNWINFTKPQTGYPIDNFKNNLAIDNPDIENTFIDPTIKEVYYNTLVKMVESPGISAQFILSEVDFKNFDFSRFVYLRTSRLQGYFFVTKIEGFKDSVTPVRVILLKV